MKEGLSGLTPATKSQNSALDPGRKDGSLPYYQLLSSSHENLMGSSQCSQPRNQPNHRLGAPTHISDQKMREVNKRTFVLISPRPPKEILMARVFGETVKTDKSSFFPSLPVLPTIKLVYFHSPL